MKKAVAAEARHGQWLWPAADTVKRLSLLMATLAIMVAVAGCHTVKGVGQDLGAAGKAVERSSGK